MAALSLSEQDTMQTAMKYVLESGGKRLRATLPVLVGQALGTTHSSHYDVGAAIEIIHNFTLVHDDIMDDDSIRRGRPSLHIAYDIPTAINAGDAMLAVSFELLSASDDIPAGTLRRLVQTIGKMVRKVAEGQQLDIDHEGRDDLSEADYLRMIEGKTAIMFETCARCGAILSAADEETVALLSEWGLALGLCFQLVDDLIDVVCDTETLGKPAGSDVLQGKRTLMVIHALNSPDSESRDALLKVLGAKQAAEEDLAAGLEALEHLGSIEYSMALARRNQQVALDVLARLESNPALDVLEALTNYHISRIT